MAERRMFARSIIGSARFLRMPASSRLLYYDLGMDADDDGYVEAFSVMRKTGASEDDLRVLASKGFIRVLNEDLVSFISDWSTNNMIRRDRYHPSVYAGQFDLSCPIQLEAPPDAGQPVVNQRLTEDSLGKDRKREVIVDAPDMDVGHKTIRKRFAPPTVDEVAAYCLERQNGIDPQRFMDHYTANGWKVGKNKMQDWRAAVRTWEQKEEKNGKNREHSAPAWTAGTVV